MAKRLVLDLDGTITQANDKLGYEEVLPDTELVTRLRAYHARGYEIIIQTARNMRTHNNSIGKINAFTVPTIVDWLQRHDIPFDEIHVGKPWCGHEGFYVDDRAIRPSEFKTLSEEQIAAMLKKEQE